MTTSTLGQTAAALLARREQDARTAALRLYWRAIAVDAGLSRAEINPEQVADALKLLGRTATDLARDTTSLRAACDDGTHERALAEAQDQLARATAALDDHQQRLTAAKAKVDEITAERFGLGLRHEGAFKNLQTAQERLALCERYSEQLSARPDFAAVGGWAFVTALSSETAAAVTP